MITEIYKANRTKPSSAFVISLMTAKNKEIIQLFSKADMATKRQVFELLKEIDLTRSNEYAKIMK